MVSEVIWKQLEKLKRVKGIYNRYIKRAIDVVLSFGGFVALSSIYAGIAIKIDNPGCVFFHRKE